MDFGFPEARELNVYKKTFTLGHQAPVSVVKFNEQRAFAPWTHAWDGGV